MGTNYYIYNQQPCECCHRPFEPRHIGKSSAGWCFALRVYPDEGIDGLDDWVEFWKTRFIQDEYGREVDNFEMLEVITKRGRPDRVWEKAPWGYGSWKQFHAANYSEQGPQGLLRHQIDGRHCVGHGEGTWDLMLGEFS